MPERAELRQRLIRALPVGTRRRDLAEVARRSAAVVGAAGAQLREVLGDRRGRAPVDPLTWLALHHRAHEADRVRSQLTEGSRSRCDPGPETSLVVVVDARDASETAVSHTVAALQAQWTSEWQVAVATTDEALDEAVGGHIGAGDRRPLTVLRAGDRPRPDLVARVLDAFWEDPSLEMVHWDEAVRTPDGLWFRPSWSPELLLSANAWGRCFALRAPHWVAFQASLGDAAWWAVLLGAGLRPDQVRRLPRVGVMTAQRHETVPAAGTDLVAAELRRRGWAARPVGRADAVWLDWEPHRWPKVSVVVPSRHSRELLGPLLDSLRSTDYPDLEVVVVDNSGPTGDKQRWYEEALEGLESQVCWWEADVFNYSAVNNHGARRATGEVLVFLNDDTEARSPGWLRSMVGWVTCAEIGTVGAQLLDPEGLIQHGGVVLGMDASAGHLFAGGGPGSQSLIGHTDWVRNVLASTAACVVVRRTVFEECGGFDERFVLCGSDVALGLEAHTRGWRNVVVPGTGMRHLESATRGRGGGVPSDLFASWWRYQRWVSAGDPYYSPSLSLERNWPALRPPGEPPAKDLMLTAMERPVGVFRQEMLEETSRGLALAYPVGAGAAEAVHRDHRERVGRHEVRTLNWVLPPFDNPFYGGLATIVRLAARLRAQHGITQRFVICDREQSEFYRSALSAGAAELAGSELVFLGGDGLEEIAAIPPADAVIATMWTTAYVAAAAPDQGRRFYLVQDHEPTFYPAGTLYALAEQTYRLGLYGICNTEPIHTMYAERYGGHGMWFLPAVDRDVYFPPVVPRAEESDGPVRIFVYARPGHWRNCWEIAQPALERIKERHGERVHLVTAGSWAGADDLGDGIEHLGLMDIRSTAELYRRCDIGVALTVSEHPSYLPGELMACGVPVVSFDLPEADWIVRHRETGMRAAQTIGGVQECIEELIGDPALRAHCSAGALAHVDELHSDWDDALGGVYRYLCDPEAQLDG